MAWVDHAWVAMLASATTGILTLIICVAITYGNDVYVGGIYPYFSDTGRDAPSYFVRKRCAKLLCAWC
jgi:hypothetical protein